nr:hypothetical protein Iba_chr13aCG10730 [Ipomoea batatas]
MILQKYIFLLRKATHFAWNLWHILISLHVQQIMTHGIICPLMYDWSNLIYRSIDDKKLACFCLREMRKARFIFRKTIPNSRSKLCRN